MATLRLCSIPDCGKPTRYLKYCYAHYGRWKRHGDPLAGRTTKPGEPRRYYEAVVLSYEGEECLTWPFGKSHGYGMLNDSPGSTRIVSRLVCEHAHGPATTPEHDAAHSCGNGHLGCVAKRHLSWKTREGNIADAIAHGTHIRGERQGLSKLTEQQVREIFALRGTMPQYEIGARYGVGQDQISRILSGKRWAWISI